MVESKKGFVFAFLTKAATRIEHPQQTMQEQLHAHDNHFHCFVVPQLPISQQRSIGDTQNTHTRTLTGPLFSPVQQCFCSHEQRKRRDLNSSLTFDDWVLWL